MNNTAKHKTFLTYLEDKYLFQKVQDRSRGSSILDFVLLNKGEEKNLGGSDRDMIAFTILRTGKQDISRTSKGQSLTDSEKE